ncbi:hypothetical protein AB0D24_04865 [Streptomyces javensis]|uniref:hypothetical protein n=1 Tax=Streptomyces javensis TaxID=114698 RepID=UPI0033FF0B68
MGEKVPQADKAEEVQRVLDAINVLGAEGDPPAVRARRLTQLLEEWPDIHAKVRAMRQTALKEMQDDGKSLRAIEAETGISYGRVREIIQGITKRPKKDKGEEASGN